MTRRRALSPSRLLVGSLLALLALAATAAAPAHDRDQVPPTSPGAVRAAFASATSVRVAWGAASDNVGVVAYAVYRDGGFLGRTSATEYPVDGLACGTSLTVSVQAYDGAGNHSPRSSGVVATSPCASPAPAVAPPAVAPARPAQPTSAPPSKPAVAEAAPPTAPPVKVRPPARREAGHSPVEAPRPAPAAGAPSPSSPLPAPTSTPTPGGAVSYVSPTGSSDGPCTQAAPCSSWNRAYQLAQPGERVLVAPGTYSSQVVASRADLRNLGGCTPADTSKCVVFEPQGQVGIDGVLEVRGSSIYVKGSRSGSGPTAGASYSISVNGSASVDATSTSDYPDNVIFEGLKAVSIGVFGADTVTFKNMDVGPATVIAPRGRCYVKEGSGFENKIGFGGGIPVVPRNVTWDGLRIHDQNGDASRELGDGGSGCHWGGLFIVTVDGLVIRNSVFERNVVYNVQLQNFGGAPAPQNVLIEGNSFGCPVEWRYRGERCAAQKSVQFDGYFPSVTLRNNVSANGTAWDGSSGLYGCYVGTCGGFAGNVITGNRDLPPSLSAPPF